jgi:hypothetical protein
VNPFAGKVIYPSHHHSECSSIHQWRASWARVPTPN